MSADSLAVHLALRNRALGLTVATTGSTTLAATTTGFTRTAGSFVTDGFAVGMEVVSSGFTASADNMTGVVTSVVAATMLVTPYVVTITNDVATVTHPALVAEGAASARTIRARFPARFATENATFIPVADIPYAEEDFVPATSTVFSAPASNGEMVQDGLYIIKWYGLSGKGTAALRKSVDALKALFSPGTKLTAGSHTVRMSTEKAAETGQIIPLTNGWSVLILTAYWQVYSNNTIAP